jgi:hypothetical protein
MNMKRRLQCKEHKNRFIGEKPLNLRDDPGKACKINARELLMFRLRQVPNAILPSDKIAEMAREAEQVYKNSKNLEWLWRNDPRFSKLLNPKRIKQAFVDPIALKRWQEEVKKASLRPIETQ